MRGMADFKTRILEHGFDGMLLDMNDKEVSVSFIGKFKCCQSHCCVWNGGPFRC